MTENADIPHIEVSVAFRGQTVIHIGGQFIDAIRFLCEAEKSVRDSLDEAWSSYVDHDGRFPGEKLRKLARYCLKVAGKPVKARVADETHHWIAGDGKKYWIGKDVNSRTYDLFISGTVKGAYKCGCPGAAEQLLASDEAKRLIRTLVKPGKFGVYLLNEKVEVSPCRG